MCNRCCATVPLSPCLAFAFADGTWNWIMSWASSCSSAVLARPQGCVPCWEKVMQSVQCSTVTSTPYIGTDTVTAQICPYSRSQQLRQCMIRAQRWCVYRKSWPHWVNWKIIPGFISSIAMANAQMWNYMIRIINRFNYKKELNACGKQQREVKVSDVIVTRGPRTFCT